MNKVSEWFKNAQTNTVVLLGVYVGGYDERNNKQASLICFDDHLEINVTFDKKITISFDEISNISVESPEEAGKRVTLTRLVALGVFALLVKKHVKEAFVVIELKDSREVIFQVKGQDKMEVKAKLSTVRLSLAK